MIECKNIFLSYGDLKVYSDFNMNIQSGENVCLSGDSGKGKSTLLKLIQGYTTPQKGLITVNNIELNAKTVQQIRNQIIWIPQNIYLPVNNGYELLDLMNLSENAEKVKDLLYQLGLDKKIINQDFKEISGGQKQRVVIAICLSLDRPIILMDEPTSALDEDPGCTWICTAKKTTGWGPTNRIYRLQSANSYNLV